MFALGKKTVNQIKYEIGCKHIVHGQGGEALILHH